MLIDSTILSLLVPNVLPDHLFVPAHCRYEVPPRPEVLPHVVPLLFRIHPGDVDRTLPLDVSDDLRHRMLRGDRNHHVHVIRQQMTFLDPALFLLRQTTKYISQLTPNLTEYALLPILRNEHNVILTLPAAVA
jgi:hypothetical protein